MRLAVHHELRAQKEVSFRLRPFIDVLLATQLTGRPTLKNSAVTQVERSFRAPLATSSDLSQAGVSEISNVLRQLLADVFVLYLKTKNFHWHMSGRNFRDYHLLLDEQAGQLFDMTDDIAERARKIGGKTLHSISDIAQHRRLQDNNEDLARIIREWEEMGRQKKPPLLQTC